MFWKREFVFRLWDRIRAPNMIFPAKVFTKIYMPTLKRSKKWRVLKTVVGQGAAILRLMSYKYQSLPFLSWILLRLHVVDYVHLDCNCLPFTDLRKCMRYQLSTTGHVGHRRFLNGIVDQGEIVSEAGWQHPRSLRI